MLLTGKLADKSLNAYKKKIVKCEKKIFIIGDGLICR